MNIKDKLLLAWLVAVMAVSFLFHNFWNCTVYAIQKAVLFGVLPPLISKIAAAVVAMQFFP